MADKLIPPDPDRCQGERTNWTFMTLGPKVYYRCISKPTVIASMRRSVGSMSLCADCVKACRKQMPGKVIYTPIVRARKIRSPKL